MSVIECYVCDDTGYKGEKLFCVCPKGRLLELEDRAARQKERRKHEEDVKRLRDEEQAKKDAEARKKQQQEAESIQMPHDRIQKAKPAKGQTSSKKDEQRRIMTDGDEIGYGLRIGDLVEYKNASMKGNLYWIYDYDTVTEIVTIQCLRRGKAAYKHDFKLFYHAEKALLLPIKRTLRTQEYQDLLNYALDIKDYDWAYFLHQQMVNCG